MPPQSHASGDDVHEGGHHGGLAALTLGSLGVVYGDIGTSPLYAFREALAAATHHQGHPTPALVLGVLSLIVWALVIVVTLKYVLILLRADNNGEGGTLSLTALVARKLRGSPGPVLALGTLGMAMFYGDSFITPAISVLSAMEGLEFIAPKLHPFIVPATLVILTLLFAVQSRGTARVATFFGPVMLIWFGVLAALGLRHIIAAPGVLAALGPWHGIAFVSDHPGVGLATLGAVFLAVTGGEALYTDLGHFGRHPIQTAWLFLVLPALILNYFGQGALVLADPQAAENPFYLLTPEPLIVPMVALATLATVIASQAVITGAFSLTRQAVQLGLFPRIEIRHTSEAQEGQIYVPRLNLILFVGVIGLVLAFRSSTGLAAAYGIAVTTTMVVDAILLYLFLRHLWRWSAPAAFLMVTPFLVIDSTFLAANLLKLFEGAWVPLVLAAAILLIVWVWTQGSRHLAAKTRRIEVPLSDLVTSLTKRPPHIVPGTAVFLTGDAAYAPTSLLHNLKHNKVLHETNVILTIRTATAPRVRDDRRIAVTRLADRFVAVTATFGFMESPDVPHVMKLARAQGLPNEIMSTSFFLSRRTLKCTAKSGLAALRGRFYIALTKNAASATDFFRIPSGRVVEVGTQVTV
jgi:KUP system potassium uptake protein